MSGVRLAALSMSTRSPDEIEPQYFEWHALDHHPEQYGIEAVRLGQRWVSTPECRAARAIEHPRFDAVDHIMQYLFADPIDQALDEWFALGAQLGKAGRMPLRLPAVELAGYELIDRCASRDALVRAEVVPWRPARGAYLLIEQGEHPVGLSSLCDVAGVAGVWRYRGGVYHERFADTTGLTLSVIYLDGDVVETAKRLGDVLTRAWGSNASTPMLAAPFATVVPWEWDRTLPY
jgi:hypothetical protein